MALLAIMDQLVTLDQSVIQVVSDILAVKVQMASSAIMAQLDIPVAREILVTRVVLGKELLQAVLPAKH